MLKKLFPVVILSIVLLFSGCSFPALSSIEDSLSPPALTEDQIEIFAELEKSEGEEIKLKYPKTGDWRNAIIMYDLDSNGEREAIAFYQSTHINAAPNVLIKILSKNNGAWTIASSIQGNGSEIEKVAFGHYGKSGSGFFAIGYNLANSTEKKIGIYSYNGTSVIANKSYSYTTFDVLDIDNDNKDEVFFVSINNELDQKPNANLISVEDDLFKVKGKVRMDDSVYEYTKCVNGVIADGRTAIYLDGKNDLNLITTEILVMNNGKLENLVYKNNNTNLAKQTLRENIGIEDINGDLQYEIPQSYTMGSESDDQEKLTDWYNYKDKKFEKIMSSYVNGTDGYVFKIPKSWEYNIGVKKDTTTGEIIFVECKNGELTDTVILKVITVLKNNGVTLNGYKEVETNGQLAYYAYIPLSVPSEYALTLTDIKENIITTR